MITFIFVHDFGDGWESGENGFLRVMYRRHRRRRRGGGGDGGGGDRKQTGEIADAIFADERSIRLVSRD